MYIIFNIQCSCKSLSSLLPVFGVVGGMERTFVREREGLTPFPFFLLGEKEEITEKRKADRANKTNPPPPPYNVVQGLDLPL